MAGQQPRFRAVAEFLRRCRKRITPEQAGVSRGRRQRGPGLRREQVAQLAGISETWYARLEQGREHGVSVQVLHSLADALRLELPEREYLLTLTTAHDEAPSPSEESLASLARLMRALDDLPSMVVDACWDVLVWSRAASRLFPSLDTLPPARRNALWLVFAEPEVGQMASDWEGQARAMVAQFRLAWARHVEHPRFDELVADLSLHSSEFACWWGEHDVRARLTRYRVYEHPIVGRLDVERHVLRILDPAELWQVMFVPVPGTESAARLRRLTTDCLAALGTIVTAISIGLAGQVA